MAQQKKNTGKKSNKTKSIKTNQQTNKTKLIKKKYKKNKKSKIGKFAKNVFLFIFVAIIFVLVGINAVKLIKKPTDVVMVQNGKIALEESAEGYLIREEVVIKGEGSQADLVQSKTEGEKIAKGEEIFRYVRKEEKEIEAQIAEIEIGRASCRERV